MVNSRYITSLLPKRAEIQMSPTCYLQCQSLPEVILCWLPGQSHDAVIQCFMSFAIYEGHPHTWHHLQHPHTCRVIAVYVQKLCPSLLQQASWHKHSSGRNIATPRSSWLCFGCDAQPRPWGNILCCQTFTTGQVVHMGCPNTGMLSLCCCVLHVSKG